jgi:hypothetical protein
MKPNAIAWVALGLFAVTALLFLGWIPDDAWISFRYAANLAHGNGLVFNPGERVEGYSNPLWTLLLAGASALGADIPATALWLGYLCAVALVAASLALYRRIVPFDGTLQVGSAILLIASMPMLFWATSGMETMAAALALLAGAALHLRAVESGDARLHLPSCLAFLALALLRPEGVMFLAFNTVVLLAAPRSRRSRRAVVVLVAVWTALAVATAWRYGYYGSVVPNTAVAKPPAGPGYYEPLLRSARYFIRFFVVSGLGLLVPFWWLAVRRGPRYPVHFLGALTLLQVAFIALVGADVLRFDRFTVPIHPLLIALALIGARAITRRRAAGRAFLVVSLAALALNGVRVHRALEKACVHDWMHARVHAALGEVLGDALPADAWIVFNEVGALPYRSALPTIDMIGLTDPVTARIVRRSYMDFGTSDTDWCGERIAEYVFSRAPDCIVLPSYTPLAPGRHETPADAFYAIWRQVYLHPDFAEFEPLLGVAVNEHKYLTVFVRAGVPARPLRLAPLEHTACAGVVYPAPGERD